ncbi:hypothetical protein J1N35_008455 [Gossypium stocksii]|uniref:GATA-type domain-containing protein n=1 Tax=Gossypium stocksii TaxID=47602 RepID=A0A9D4AEG7_9ROSI|nr:hypothetical protein J1N35_008455 [Gossypium stocksii]
MDVPSKMKVFCCKLCSNAIPSRHNLWKRSCSPTPLCFLCGIEEESIEHIFFGCSLVRGIWFECCFGLRICKEHIQSFDAWFAKVLSNSGGVEGLSIRVVFICWFIWKMRCEVIFGGKQVDINGAICRIKLTTQEYLAVKNECLVERVSKVEGSVVEVWGKPPVGWVKINCDGP